MQFKTGKKVHIYYFIVLLTIMVGITAWFYSFYRSGAFDTEIIQTVFESSIQIDKLKKSNPVNQMHNLVALGKMRESINLIVAMDKTVRNMDRSVKHFPDEYENLTKSIVKSKASLNSLLSLPDITTVVTVLRRKFKSFKLFASENRWPTLTRISSRVYAELEGLNLGKAGFLNHYKIQKMDNSINRNIKSMERITVGSVLSPYDKKLILAKIKSFAVELKMIKQFLPELKKFSERQKNLSTNYQKWVKLIEPEVAVAKMGFQKNFKMMFISFVGIVLFVLAAIAFGFYFYKREAIKSDEKIENKILECIQEGVLSNQLKVSDNYSKEFLMEMGKYHSWVKNRMSFGNIFQEALPFPSLLLDSNLNLVWANTMFYSEWNLDEYKNRRDEELNWEFLQRFTNLGENDPVLEALKNNLAGIYQIQVKQEDKDSTPYEMYISPVEQDDQKRIMIFFYPLMFLEETIQDQKKSLVGPVVRSLEALSKGEFTKDFRERVSEDFNIAGIESVFGKFIRLSEFINRQKAGLISEMERLENELYDKHKILCDMRGVLDQQNVYVENEVKSFQETRDTIVNLVELRRKTEQIYLGTINASKVMLKEQTHLYENSTGLVENHEENIRIFKTIIGARDGFRDIISKVEECKTQLAQTLEQTMIFTKTDKIHPANLAQSLMRIKVELKALDKEIGSFVGNIRGFDIQLSKIQMILEDIKTPNLMDYQNKLELTRGHIENDTFNMGVNSREGQKIDEEIIEKMKSFYQNLKGNREMLIKMKDLAALTVDRTPEEGVVEENDITNFSYQNKPMHETTV